MMDAQPNLSQRQFDHVISRGVLMGRESVTVTDDVIEPPGPRILFVNRAFTELTGYRADEILGASPRVLQGPLTDRSLLNELRRSLARRDRFDGETVNYRKSGEPFVVNWRVLPVDTDEGRYFMALQSDVTRRRQTERHETGLAYLESAIRSVMRLGGDDPRASISAILTALCSTVDVYLQGGESVAQLGVISTGTIGRREEMAPGEMEIDYGPAGAQIRMGLAEVNGAHGTLVVRDIEEDRLRLANLAHVQQFGDMIAAPVRAIIAEGSTPD
jgi:PAS domain S-box-containing protein